jgi:hypothetical protein
VDSPSQILKRKDTVHCPPYVFAEGSETGRVEGEHFPAFRASSEKWAKRSRSATPIVHISTGPPGKFAAACDSRGSGVGARPDLIDPLNREPAEEARVDLLAAAGSLVFGCW